MSNKRNLSVEGIRGILMLWIILFHYTFRYNELYPERINYKILFENGGEIGVLMFFIISGYFFSNMIFKTPTVQNSIDSIKELPNNNICGINYRIRGFIYVFSKRYIKLYIPYFVSCVLILLLLHFCPLENRTANPLVALINLLSIYHPTIGYIDAAHWFLADLVKIQFLMMLLCLVNINHRKALYMFLFALITLLFIVSNFVNTPLSSKITYIFSLRNLFVFNIGIFTNQILQEEINIMKCDLIDIKSSTCQKINKLILFICVISIILFSFNYLLLLYYLTFVLLLFDNKYIKHFTSWQIFVYIGKFSFYWYLVHQNIGYVILNYLTQFTDSELILVIPLLVTFGAALIVKRMSNYVARCIRFCQ